MKNILALFSGLTILTLAGCSSQQDYKTASGNYDYLEASEQASLKVPGELDKPDFSQEFSLPQVDENVEDEPVGKSLSVQSPALVLPLVSGSHIEEGKKDATVWFDQVDDSQPLATTIWNNIRNYLDENNIGVASFDEANNRLVTEWVAEKQEDESSWYTSWYKWAEEDKIEIARRFVFTLDVKPHGRTAALHAQLQDYKTIVNGDSTVTEVDDITERREEVEILNEVIAYYDYQLKLHQTKRIAQIRRGLNIELGFDDQGEPAYVVDAQYDIAWPRLLLVLRKLGFDVKDLDKSTGLLFVNYNGGDDGWWNNFFSSDDELLEEGNYRLKVAAAGSNRTTITFMNDESEPFEPKQVADMYDQFSQVMSEDNLDI
ncbi:outer membrane protein assembly factor BamC [Alteromonas sp. C1M14]|uniref:outer membrane protein assembly factor BamC n=1 Tax=Alteromonas sp. C1M14 TaxID=2841567 RepID=UPI001C097CEE|nr:outer membrane protein assembly factor BamC [Alteromonas sp. C1M14]MBU2976796.1 outer membrane protein assembly factor BamC [Alteromonas sp. C1M14]